MKEDGFSLLELLAVIVILAIIAVIASPIILGMIEDSRKSTFAASINGIKKAIEADYSSREFDTHSEYTYTNGVLELVSNGTKTIVPTTGSVSGESSGVAYVDSNGKIYIAIYSTSYCGYIGSEDYTNATVISAKEITKEECFQKINR